MIDFLYKDFMLTETKDMETDNSTVITVFTPTFNRAHTLSRVYQSLLNQTDKNLNWLIIDDGSNDNTKELVKKWIAEKKITINYCHKKNGGKHTAMSLGYKIACTKYLMAIDSDDELTPEAVKIFKYEWRQIERYGCENQFAGISGLFSTVDGKLVGNYHFTANTEYIDSNWHEMVLKFKNNNEHITCWNLEKLRECVDIPEKFWLSDKVSLFGESTLWARVGRKYKTRYLNKKVGIYHYDGGESLKRSSDFTTRHYNNLATHIFFLDENLGYFFWNPRYFINLVLKIIISGIELRIFPNIILKKIKSLRLKITYLLFWPIGLTGWLYFKFIKRCFWF